LLFGAALAFCGGAQGVFILGNQRSSMKKTTSAKTTAKSPAPATAAKTIAPAPALKFTGVPRLKASQSATAKGGNDDLVIVAPPPAATVITAQIDVGFGNTLFIRGDGPGLTWIKGVPLGCTAVDRWTISLLVTNRPVVFKFLINDKTWSAGDDYVAQPGGTIAVTPVF
jgi:hypothetical protein